MATYGYLAHPAGSRSVPALAVGFAKRPMVASGNDPFSALKHVHLMLTFVLFRNMISMHQQISLCGQAGPPNSN